MPSDLGQIIQRIADQLSDGSGSGTNLSGSELSNVDATELVAALTQATGGEQGGGGGPATVMVEGLSAPGRVLTDSDPATQSDNAKDITAALRDDVSPAGGGSAEGQLPQDRLSAARLQRAPAAAKHVPGHLQPPPPFALHPRLQCLHHATDLQTLDRVGGAGPPRAQPPRPGPGTPPAPARARPARDPAPHGCRVKRPASGAGPDRAAQQPPALPWEWRAGWRSYGYEQPGLALKSSP